MSVVSSLVAAGRRRWRAAATGEDGVTMVELMVSMIVFALIATGVLSVVSRGLDLTRNDHNRTVASNLASQELDAVRDQAGVDATQLVQGLVTHVDAVDAVPYTVARSTQWVSQGSTSSPCVKGAGNQRSQKSYLRVDVDVTWPRMTGTTNVKDNTIVFPKVGTFDPSTGGLAVLVDNRNNQPYAGQHVTITGPGGSFSQTTPSNGCAFFDYLTPGTYQVTLANVGEVDYQGNSTPSTSAAVAIGKVNNSLTMYYENAAELDVTPTARDASHPAAPGFPVRFGNNLLQPTGVSKAFCGYTYPAAAPAYPCKATGLFPFTTGDTVWMGDCIDAKPAKALKVSLSPNGVTAIGSSTLAALQVNVYRSGVAAPDGTPVFITHAAEATPAGCSTQRTYRLGTTTSGKLLTGIPLGTWTVSATTPVAPQATKPGSLTTYDRIVVSSAGPTATAQVTG